MPVFTLQPTAALCRPGGLRQRATRPFSSGRSPCSSRRALRWCRAAAEPEAAVAEQQAAAGVEQTSGSDGTDAAVQLDVDREVTKFARSAATTFAPRASGATKNPAYKGSVLYTVFEVQAWLALAVGALLSFNALFPSDQPDIARLLGMWSMWMFTIPSLRARECTAAEKDALNVLFLAIPLLNIALPFLWKSFPFIFTADCALMAGVYGWKSLLPWQEAPPEEGPQ
eukprot:scaffold4.g4758.t1